MDQSLVLGRDNFDRLLSESVDEVFTELLGRNVKQAVYAILRKHYCIASDQIPTKLDAFAAVMGRLFEVSSETICKLVVKRLSLKLGLDFVEKPDYVFLDYLRDARFSTARILRG